MVVVDVWPVVVVDVWPVVVVDVWPVEVVEGLIVGMREVVCVIGVDVARWVDVWFVVGIEVREGIRVLESRFELQELGVMSGVRLLVVFG